MDACTNSYLLSKKVQGAISGLKWSKVWPDLVLNGCEMRAHTQIPPRTYMVVCVCGWVGKYLRHTYRHTRTHTYSHTRDILSTSNRNVTSFPPPHTLSVLSLYSHYLLPPPSLPSPRAHTLTRRIRGLTAIPVAEELDRITIDFCGLARGVAATCDAAGLVETMPEDLVVGDDEADGVEASIPVHLAIISCSFCRCTGLVM